MKKDGRGRPRKHNRTVHPFIKILHVERKRKRIPLRVMTSIVGYGVDSIGSFERGDHIPNLLKLVDWCESLGFELKMVRKDEKSDQEA